MCCTFYKVSDTMGIGGLYHRGSLGSWVVPPWKDGGESSYTWQGSLKLLMGGAQGNSASGEVDLVWELIF